MLLFILKDVIGENYESALEPYLLADGGYVKIVDSFLSPRPQILTIPSPKPAQRYSEFFENAREVTGAPILYT